MTFAGDLDWHLTNDQGWTALDEAESREFQDIAELGYLARAQFRRRTEAVVAYLSEKCVKSNQEQGNLGE